MVSTDEINTDDGKLNGNQKKNPLEAAAIQEKLHRLVTLTGYGEAVRTNQRRTGRLH